MAIYLDSAKLDEARQAQDLGWVFGVTTNPTLLAKAGTAPEAVLEGLAGLEFHRGGGCPPGRGAAYHGPAGSADESFKPSIVCADSRTI